MAWYLIIAMFAIGIAPRVEAAFSPSEALALSPIARAGDMEKIRLTLENKLVSQRLEDLGYSAQEITTRLSDLSDNQIHSLAQRLDSMKVGQDGAAVLIFFLVLIIAILVILQVTGRKVIVTK